MLGLREETEARFLVFLCHPYLYSRARLCVHMLADGTGGAPFDKTFAITVAGKDRS